MHTIINSFQRLIVAVSLVIIATTTIYAEQSAKVSITIDKSLLTKPFTGRVYAVIAPKAEKKLPLQANFWFAPMEIMSKKVNNWTGDEPIVLTRNDDHYLKATTAEDYEMQVLLRVNQRNANPFASPGNLYSEPVALSQAEVATLDKTLKVVNIIETGSPLMPTKAAETEQLKLFPYKSDLLSDFHKQDYFVNVAVRLPKGHADSDKQWPVLYYISGMGGNEVEFLRLMKGKESYFDQFITVSVDAMNFGGHSVFADSANTGPWGRLIVDEIAPMVDNKYRGAGPSKRYLTGISSGGWSSLWLQVTYPKDFAGTWSFVPDSIDFRDFQRVNFYAPGQNIYTDNLGQPRYVARTGKGMPWILSKDFNTMESAMGEGGQIRSFEYVFSDRGEDGLPVPLFDRKTGAINHEVAKTWKKYDIRLILTENWQFLKNDLEGKLHVYGGEKDQFFLEGPVRLLKEDLTYLGASEDIRVIAGLAHAFDEDSVIAMLKEITGEEN